MPNKEKENKPINWGQYQDDKDPEITKAEEEIDQIAREASLKNAGGEEHGTNRRTIESARKLAQENREQDRKFQIENIGLGGKEAENSMKSFKESHKNKPK